MKVLIPIDWSDNCQKAFDSNDRDMHAKEVKLMDLQETYETRLLQRKVDYRWVNGSEGSPGELILKVANEESVQMIVMGSRGLGMIKKAILGSVSDYVLNKANVPVLICKRTS